MPRSSRSIRGERQRGPVRPEIVADRGVEKFVRWVVRRRIEELLPWIVRVELERYRDS